MPDIGTENNPLDPSSLYAYDGTNWHPVRGTSSGHLLTSDLYLGASLGAGQLSGAVDDIYTVPTGQVAIVDQLWLYNTNVSATVAVTVMVKRVTGTARTLAKLSLAVGDGVCLTIGPLSGGDIVRAQASTSLSIDYTLLGRVTA
jgi:hypothetical protein